MKYFLLLLAVIAACFARAPVRFDGYQVYRIIPKNNYQLETLKQLEQNPVGYNFWTDVSAVGQFVDIMVPPHLKYDFQDMLALQKLDTQLMIENVQTLVDNEKSVPAGKSDTFNWDAYQSLAQINAWLSFLEEQYPGIVKVVEGGRTYEGRKILGIHISFKSGNEGVFLEGGIHAREWIAPATVTYIANELLTSTDPQVREVAESRDWYIFPVVNPDGYEYTRTTNRMWRKTRKPYGLCYGADPNRNWGYQWMNGGASSSSCMDTFAGSSAFSEIETASLSQYISSIASNLHMYLGFHSYSQLLLIPFGHANLEVPSNNDELHTIGKNAVAKLAEHYGTRYTVGNIPEVIYVASGGSSDWVMGTYRHINPTFTFELRDTGRYGFLLPPAQIIPTGEETLSAVVSMVLQKDGKQN